jgi:hypothetical protein
LGALQRYRATYTGSDGMNRGRAGPTGEADSVCIQHAAVPPARVRTFSPCDLAVMDRLTHDARFLPVL